MMKDMKDGGEMYEQERESALKSLIQEMYDLMISDGEKPEEEMAGDMDGDMSEDMPESFSMMGEEDEMESEEEMDEEEDPFQSEVKDFMGGKKPTEDRKQGVAVAISSKLAGLPMKKKKKGKY